MKTFATYYQENGEWHYLGDILKQCAELAIVETARKAKERLKADSLCFDIVKVEEKK